MGKCSPQARHGPPPAQAGSDQHFLLPTLDLRMTRVGPLFVGLLFVFALFATLDFARQRLKRGRDIVDSRRLAGKASRLGAWIVRSSSACGALVPSPGVDVVDGVEPPTAHRASSPDSALVALHTRPLRRRRHGSNSNQTNLSFPRLRMS